MQTDGYGVYKIYEYKKGVLPLDVGPMPEGSLQSR